MTPASGRRYVRIGMRSASEVYWVLADVRGGWAAHHALVRGALDYERWSVTHVESGKAIVTRVSQTDALTLLDTLADLCQDVPEEALERGPALRIVARIRQAVLTGRLLLKVSRPTALRAS